MNLPVAQNYLRDAVVQRDVALWFRQKHAATGMPHFADCAANCRVQMRIAAKRMVDHLRPLAATHELLALGRRQARRDIDSASFLLRQV